MSSRLSSNVTCPQGNRPTACWTFASRGQVDAKLRIANRFDRLHPQVSGSSGEGRRPAGQSPWSPTPGSADGPESTGQPASKDRSTPYSPFERHADGCPGPRLHPCQKLAVTGRQKIGRHPAPNRPPVRGNRTDGRTAPDV